MPISRKFVPAVLLEPTRSRQIELPTQMLAASAWCVWVRSDEGHNGHCLLVTPFHPALIPLLVPLRFRLRDSNGVLEQLTGVFGRHHYDVKFNEPGHLCWYAGVFNESLRAGRLETCDQSDGKGVAIMDAWLQRQIASSPDERDEMLQRAQRASASICRRMQRYIAKLGGEDVEVIEASYPEALRDAWRGLCGPVFSAARQYGALQVDGDDEFLRTCNEVGWEGGQYLCGNAGIGCVLLRDKIQGAELAAMVDINDINRDFERRLRRLEREVGVDGDGESGELSGERLPSAAPVVGSAQVVRPRDYDDLERLAAELREKRVPHERLHFGLFEIRDFQRHVVRISVDIDRVDRNNYEAVGDAAADYFASREQRYGLPRGSSLSPSLARDSKRRR